MTTTDPALETLYRDFADAGLLPLWTQREDLMPLRPQPAAKAHVWRWRDLYPIAERAGELVPVGRGGERRAIALANPGLHGEPYATPTLWAAIQYLGPREVAPAHRHSQGAFRFVVEGEGVWTVVNGDPVAMRRGDLLLTPSWAFHEHHNPTDRPMAWLDGLDIPLVSGLDAGFFEFGPDTIADTSTPDVSRGERLWAHPGLRPLAGIDDPPPVAPMAPFRWRHTDEALTAQLTLAAEGHPGAIEPGHAGIRFVNPATGGDALTSMRTEMHRLAEGRSTPVTRTVGSSVWQVFSGEGVVQVGQRRFDIATGDLVAVPSWEALSFHAGTDLDLFTFNDAPVYQALRLYRTDAR